MEDASAIGRGKLIIGIGRRRVAWPGVVAGAVKQLSGRTRTATKEIAELLQTLNTQTRRLTEHGGAARDAKAARRLMKKLLEKQGLAPSRVVTDKLRSYASA